MAKRMKAGQPKSGRYNPGVSTLDDELKAMAGFMRKETRERAIEAARAARASITLPKLSIQND